MFELKASSLITSCILLVFLVSIGTAQRLSDYRDPDVHFSEGWEILFNGKDFTGWVPVLRTEDGGHKKYLEGEVNEQSTFYVENGLLKTTGEPPGYIRTADVYENYVFHVEIRYPGKGNTGVLIHVQRDTVWPRAIECQGYEDHMGRIFPIRGATLLGGEMIHAAARPTGEWNTYEVYSSEGRIATVLNGKLVGLAEDADPKLGYIALQSEGVPVEFRNIKMKRFTPAHHLRGAPGPE